MITKNVKITMNRIGVHGRTPDCLACARVGGILHNYQHSDACRKRFNILISGNGPPVNPGILPAALARGVKTAAAAVSDIVSEVETYFSKLEADALQSHMQDELQELIASDAYKKRVSGCIAAVAASAASSPRAVGSNMLLEFCCSPESQLGKTSSKLGVSVIRLHESF